MSGNQADYGFTRDTIDSVRRLLDTIDRLGRVAIPIAVRRADPTRNYPPALQDFIAGELIGLLHEGTNQGRRAVDSAEELVNQAGSPSTLEEWATAFDVSVKSPSNDLAADVRADKLKGTLEENWSGAAAERYRQAGEGQGDAIRRISASSDALADVLRGLAGQLNGFVWSMTGAILVFAASLVGVAASLVAAPETVGASLWVLAAAVATSVAAFAGGVVAVGIQFRQTELLAQKAGLSIERWPSSRLGGR